MVDPPRRTPPPSLPVKPVDGQLCLFGLRGPHCVIYDTDHQAVAEQEAVHTARRVLRRLAETRGWGKATTTNTQRALAIVLDGHANGDQLTHSHLTATLRTADRRLSVERTSQVLREMGIYVDDRRTRLDGNIEAKLDGLAPGIAAETERWVRDLAGGGLRQEPRSKQTAMRYLHSVQPALLAWSQHYSHLREVTRDDVLTHIAPLTGNIRQQTLVSLRSLFRAAKKTGAVFRNPTSHIRVGAAVAGVLQPLPAEHIQQTVAAATRPADPLIIALATIHAARGHVIRNALLDDVDLGNRRISLAGRAHPLDELTYRVLRNWLNYRRKTWPTTPNLHLIINRRTAATTAHVGHSWLSEAFRGLPAGLEQLRMDRQLEEAIVHGADPRHLTAVFDIDEKTALRYADSARQLLVSELELSVRLKLADGGAVNLRSAK